MTGFALSLLTALASTGDETSFRFQEGTRWTYVGTSQGQKTTVVQEVLQVRPGEQATVFQLLTKSRTEGPAGELEAISTGSYIGLEDGHFVTGTLGGVAVRLYKKSSRKGDSWPCTEGSDRVFTNLGVEEVTVPAGTFPQAHHVQVRVQTPGGVHTGDFYIVPGVGIVKTQATSEENGVKKSVLLELVRFTVPGES